MDMPAYGEKNLAKRLAENDKKISVEPCQVGKRVKVLKRFWKSFEKVRGTSQNWYF